MEILKSFVDDWGNLIVLAILMSSTILFVLEVSGLLPFCISERLAKKRIISQKLILEQMGINFTDEKRSRIRARAIDFFSNKSKSKIQVTEELISDYTYDNGEVFNVGKTHNVPLSKFIDLMSASTDPNISIKMAQILSSYIRNNPSLQFDFIVTSKNGTPILGYELAKLLQVPCVFHVNSQEKFTCESKSNEYYQYSKFDVASKTILSPRSKGLIVDDSTTGGRKVTALVNDLRELNCEVSDCLVIFEPTAKEVNKTLNQIGIRLHSLVKV